MRITEAETAMASPFARSLLLAYVGAFMYEGDSPLAERRAQALTLDSVLLAELLGQAELRELLDPEVIAEAQQEAQRLPEGRQARGLEGVADLLREAGPLSADEVMAAVHLIPMLWPDGSPSSKPRGGPSRCGSLARAAGRRLRTPADFVTRLEYHCLSAFLRPSPSLSQIRSAISSPATHGRTARSTRQAPPPGTGSASRS